MAEDTTLHAEGERTHIVNPRRLIQPREETHKYRLKTPTFTVVEDVEQFASEFHETWDITRWPPRVALAKLRGALTGEAKPYGQRPSVNGIFVASRARFGITAPDARSCLQRLLRKEDTPLQDHALAVKRLARIAYSDLPETQRQQYTLEDFTQSLNHPSLNHQLQARGVTSLEAALREGVAYLRAQRLYEDPQTESRPPGGVPTTTLEASLHTATERLLTLMTRAMTAIAGAKASSTTTPPDSRKPRRPPRPREPVKESIQGVPRRKSIRTPRRTPNGWQTPRKTGRRLC